ncbi:uncharacterized protein [Apostichopus japonicus]|uniref:uncharacterized protein n=1 Tax=Stichopus japonicus TaxID=307972 RepID=UPI003AB805BE
MAQITYQGRPYQLPAYIVKGKRPSLLGREWLRDIKLDWHSIFAVEGSQPVTVQELKVKYPTVFATEGRPIEGFKANVQVADGTVPKFFKPRSVPYSLKPKVEAELKRLVNEQIITKVDRSDWATPIVVGTQSGLGDPFVWGL